MLDAYLYGGLRSPFGRHGGALATVRPDDLAAAVIQALIARSGFAPAQIEDVVLGCAAQSGEDGRNIARHAALLAGLPVEVPGQTVNRLCGSGLAAVLDVARAVSCGEGELYVAGGVESMSRAPFVVAKPQAAWSRDFTVYDSTIGARFPNPALVARYGNDSMPETADIVAHECGVTRDMADRFAAASQSKYQAARAAGFFTEEIVPVTAPGGRGAPQVVDEDEHPRPQSTLARLAALKPLFGGVVTAGNASGINDGAAAVLVGSCRAGERAGIRPQARILAGAVAGVAPRTMGLGPVCAIPKALARAGLSLTQMDVIEINEAFAPQVLACLLRLNLDVEDARVNPNGGAIALGHPLAASGARLVLSTARELHRRNGRYAVLSLCIGVGQGIALVIERCAAQAVEVAG
ncbi:3-oxoadipyl-CoA thiolase [Zoogloeaceae bacterium G21618-S1]|nr:3-oxoadipyl-CoA thiolase [Zoogloeaceae bacterium G21618-S1]